MTITQRHTLHTLVAGYRMNADRPILSAGKNRPGSIQTKIRLYNALVISVLLYGSETWTLLKADERRLEALIANDGS